MNVMKTIQLRTEVPGPKSMALVARREAAIPRGPQLVTPIFAAKDRPRLTEGNAAEDLRMTSLYRPFALGLVAGARMSGDVPLTGRPSRR